MLNEFYAAVKLVHEDNLVVTGGTAPYGDPVPGGRRMPPIRWGRDLLCLSSRLRKRSCPTPARFDIYDHHPYAVAGPYRRALNEDDASVPDVRKIARLLRAARSQRTALPTTKKRMWVTEVSWDSNPPDPDGVPEARQARYLAEAFSLLRRQGVDTILWLLMRDTNPTPSYASTYQSGVYFRDGQRKLSAQAFRFPFIVERRDRRRLLLWARAPIAGKLIVERRSGGKWRRVASKNLAAGTVYQRTVRRKRAKAASYRARIGAETSLTYKRG